MTATPLDLPALAGAEPLLEDLDLAEDALANLVRLTGVAEAALRIPGGWRASVEVEGTRVFLVAYGERWAILAPPGEDESEAMLAARRIHGRLGEAAEGWDLDR